MLIKKLIIFPAVIISSATPLVFTSLNKSSTEISKIFPSGNNKDIINPSGRRSNLREYWLENCRPLNDEENTIYACQEWIKSPFATFYYKFEYKSNKVDSPFSVLVEKVKSLRYDKNKDTLVVEFYKGGSLTLKNFPKEFKELKKDSSLIPNKDCLWESDELKWPNSPLRCSFDKEGEYMKISLAK